MIDTLNILVQRDNSIVLLLAGTENGYATYLMQYAKDLGIEKNVVFTGWLDREGMKRAYAVCNVVTTPSIYFDAFNLFNIEAGAAGKPVVGTCFGGTPEIVLDKKTGIIVNPNNIQMMSDALYSILQNIPYQRQLGEAARQRVEDHFTIKRYVADTLVWYQTS